MVTPELRDRLRGISQTLEHSCQHRLARSSRAAWLVIQGEYPAARKALRYGMARRLDFLANAEHRSKMLSALASLGGSNPLSVESSNLCGRRPTASIRPVREWWAAAS